MKVKIIPQTKKTFQNSLKGFLFLLVFFSCANVFSEPLREVFSSFPTIESITPSWQSFANGVSYFQGKTASPTLEFWALRVDLSSPNTRIVTGNGTANPRLSAKVSSFVRDNNLIAGINAVPFDNVSSVEGQAIRNIGIVVSGGVQLTPVSPRYDAIIFYKNGGAAIRSQASIQSMDNIENAIGGFYQILKSSEPAQRTLNLSERHPRSAAGISANGRYLYLLVVDGRRAGSIGSTERETALLLKSLGSWDGINFDGGGSSALALRYQDGNVRTVNFPVHSGIPGMERAVAGCLGVAVSPSMGR